MSVLVANQGEPRTASTHKLTPKKRSIPESYHHAENIFLKYFGKGLSYVLSTAQDFASTVQSQPDGPYKDMMTKLIESLDSEDVPEVMSPLISFVREIQPSTLDPDSPDFSPMVRAQMKLLLRVVKSKVGDDRIDGLFKEIDKYPEILSLLKKHNYDNKDEL